MSTAVKAGDKFGMLTLVSRVDSPSRHPRWLMRCDCGTEKIIDLGAVKSGRQVACGCFRLKRVAETRSVDLSGRKVGMLTVLRFYTKHGKERLWLCECDCGCGYIGYGSHLASGAVKSCGCIRRPFHERPKTKTDLSKYAANHARRAKLRGAAGKFTRQDIERIFQAQKGRCAWCHCPLGSKFHRDHRIPLAKGGSNDPGNIELLCAVCNIRKHDKDPIDWANMNGKLL